MRPLHTPCRRLPSHLKTVRSFRSNSSLSVSLPFVKLAGSTSPFSSRPSSTNSVAAGAPRLRQIVNHLNPSSSTPSKGQSFSHPIAPVTIVAFRQSHSPLAALLLTPPLTSPIRKHGISPHLREGLQQQGCLSLHHPQGCCCQHPRAPHLRREGWRSLLPLPRYPSLRERAANYPEHDR